MPPKRKSDAMESAPLEAVAEASTSTSTTNAEQIPLDVGPRKKARVSDASKAKKASKEATDGPKPQSWRDIKLEGEDEKDIQVYDDCNDVRRKIKKLQQTPGWKVTEWLSEIGINSNSYGRFMKASGKYDGSSNGTYFAAYVYFEKMRIFEGKKKTAKRIANEKEHRDGLKEKASRGTWVFTGK